MRYFKIEEFTMGEENVFARMDIDLLDTIDNLRENVGEPLHINSSFRTTEHNKSVGGSTRSQHLVGKAVDFRCTDGSLRAKIVKEALKLGCRF